MMAEHSVHGVASIDAGATLALEAPDAAEDGREEQAQLELFEGEPVTAYKAALGSAVDIDISERLSNNDLVRFSGEGIVVKTTFHTKMLKGGVRKTTRIVSINVEDITIEI